MTKSAYLTDEDRRKLIAIFTALNEAYPLMSEREKGNIEGTVEEIRRQAIRKRTAWLARQLGKEKVLC